MNLKLSPLLLLFLIPLFLATFSFSGRAAYGKHLPLHKGQNGIMLSKNAQQKITFQKLHKDESKGKILDNLRKSGGGGGHGRGGGIGGGTGGAANHHTSSKNKNGGSIKLRPFSLVLMLSLAYALLSH